MGNGIKATSVQNPRLVQFGTILPLHRDLSSGPYMLTKLKLVACLLRSTFKIHIPRSHSRSKSFLVAYGGHTGPVATALEHTLGIPISTFMLFIFLMFWNIIPWDSLPLVPAKFQ